jgi:hypothetical protein
VATSILQTHWSTWITEADFVAIAAAGCFFFCISVIPFVYIRVNISLNHVRVPIGYWAFDTSGGEPFIQGQVNYLQNAARWAQNTGLKLIVDLHGWSKVQLLDRYVIDSFSVGAPGSQNGSVKIFLLLLILVNAVL